MTHEERTALFTEIIAAAREGKKSALGPAQRREFSRIIRLTKRLYIDISKEATTEVAP